MTTEKDSSLKDLDDFAPFDRIKGYQLNKFGADPLKVYLWNIHLSESLYQSLYFLEITFRNAVSKAISQAFLIPNWLIENKLLEEREANKVSAIINELTAHKQIISQGKIIAELNFGFWTSLLDTRYEQILWPKIIKIAFPNMPSKIRTRRTLSKRFNKIRFLRNRIFHYEPIWHWKDLKNQYEGLLEALDWIEPKAAELLRGNCRFLTIYQKEPT